MVDPPGAHILVVSEAVAHELGLFEGAVAETLCHPNPFVAEADNGAIVGVMPISHTLPGSSVLGIAVTMSALAFKAPPGPVRSHRVSLPYGAIRALARLLAHTR